MEKSLTVGTEVMRKEIQNVLLLQRSEKLHEYGIAWLTLTCVFYGVSLWLCYEYSAYQVKSTEREYKILPLKEKQTDVINMEDVFLNGMPHLITHLYEYFEI